MWTTVEAAEGRTAPNNGWNGANGTASNTREPRLMYLTRFHSFWQAGGRDRVTGRAGTGGTEAQAAGVVPQVPPHLSVTPTRQTHTPNLNQPRLQPLLSPTEEES